MRRAVCVALFFASMVCAAPIVRAGEAPRPAPVPSPQATNPDSNRDANGDNNYDMSAPANYDEVVTGLVNQLLDRQPKVAPKETLSSKKKKKEESEREALSEKERYTINAQDAARKLVSLGKRAVPDLTLLFKANYNSKLKGADGERAEQVAYYAAWALARIRNADAARALTPLMTNPAAPTDLRMIAVDAAGWEKYEEGVAVLEKAAMGDPDLEIRKHALAQIAMIPEYWTKTEPIFVKALSDPNDDIRIQAAKACHFAHIFTSAVPKLIEAIEKDPSSSVKMYAMLTLARMRVVKAEAALVRILQQPNTDEKTSKQALTTISQISTIPFRNADGVTHWWNESGKADFDKLMLRDLPPDELTGGNAKALPIKAAPKFLRLDELPGVTGAIESKKSDADAEVVPLPASPEKPAPTTADALTKVPVQPQPPADPPLESLSPNESTGSQLRRLRNQRNNPGN